MGHLVQAQQSSPNIEPVADTVVDPAAWTFSRGNWGTAVNGQTFQQEAVVTFKGYQYASYFTNGGYLSVARRKLPDGEWQQIRFDDYKSREHNDVHNVAVIGIAEADGTIHLSFDHHVNDLHYRRSIQGLASDPDNARWDASSFGPVTSKLDGSTAIRGVTYPQFYPTHDGALQLIYRTGSSGNGDWHLAEYDPSGEGKWTVLGMILSGKGQYENSPTRCAYPNQMRFDPAGRLHMTWTWREAPAGGPLDLRTNHDLMYAWSDDRGRTWKDNAGNPIARTGDSPIAIDTPNIIIAKTKWMWGQMNTTTQVIDSKNRVHVVNWQQPQDASEGSRDLNTWRYYHYWRDVDGTWHEQLLPFVGRKPQIVVDPSGNAMVVYVKGSNSNYHNQDPGGALMVSMATEASGWKDWKTVWKTDRMSIGEPLIDNQRWAAEQVLSIYLQDKPQQNGKPSSLRVLDFKVGAP
jgi:hypothetical protein